MHRYPLNMMRVEVLQSLFDSSGKGLEIGPSHNPLMPKTAGFDVEILDYLDADHLRSKYAEAGCDVSRVEEVDYISDGRRMFEVIGQRHRYDWIVASHVVEHVPDLLAFFNDCEALLKPNGSLVLAVPDKRCCFDILRPLSTVGQVLQAHVDGRTKPPPGVIFDDLAYARKRNDQIGWSLTSREPLTGVRSVEQAARFFENTRDTGEYVDVHCWVFVPSSFRLIVNALRSLEMTRLSEQRFCLGEGEFYAVLAAGASPGPIDLGSLALAAQTEERLSNLINSDPATQSAAFEVESPLVRLQRELTLAVEAQSNALEKEARSAQLVSSVTNSMSWKVTAPLRSMKRLIMRRRI